MHTKRYGAYRVVTLFVGLSTRPPGRGHCLRAQDGDVLASSTLISLGIMFPHKSGAQLVHDERWMTRPSSSATAINLL
jgi:hypothetical protein